MTEQASSPARHVVRRDASTILTVVALLALLIPSRFTVGPLGGAGGPATLVGVAALGGWLFMHVSRVFPRVVVPLPFRTAMLAFGGAALASFVVVANRPGADDELRLSALAIIVLASWAGIALMATDFLIGWQSIDTLVARLTTMVGFYALFGIVQYFTGRAGTEWFAAIPGLSLNTQLDSIANRDGLLRPASTAIHAIEFGVVLTSLLPLCLHVLLYGRALPSWRRWFPTIAVIAAIPLCISRSAIVTGAVALAVLLPTWPSRARTWTLGGVAVAAVATFVSAPGVLGTIENSFTKIGTDSSALSRTDSYGVAMEFIARSPWIGRGFGTFLPDYRILDNQYLLTTIEVGAIGLAALLAVFVTSLVCARLVRRRSSDPRRRDLAQALFASIAAAAVGFAFFDALSFPQFAAVVFLVLGLNGAAWRTSTIERELAPAAELVSEGSDDLPREGGPGGGTGAPAPRPHVASSGRPEPHGPPRATS